VNTTDRAQRQRKLLDRLARQIPVLLKAAEGGDSNKTIMIVGHKRLPDGRLIEVKLAAEVTDEEREVGASFNELPSKTDMCGRFVSRAQAAIERYFNARPHQFQLVDRYNIAPSNDIAVIRMIDSGRTLNLMR
jgi:hypothetical protein